MMLDLKWPNKPVSMASRVKNSMPQRARSPANECAIYLKMVCSFCGPLFRQHSNALSPLSTSSGIALFSPVNLCRFEAFRRIIKSQCLPFENISLSRLASGHWHAKNLPSFSVFFLSFFYLLAKKFFEFIKSFWMLVVRT